MVSATLFPVKAERFALLVKLAHERAIDAWDADCRAAVVGLAVHSGYCSRGGRTGAAEPLDSLPKLPWLLALCEVA